MIKNPQYSSPDKSTIDVDLNHPEYGWIPFTASPDDSEQIGQDIFHAAQAGEYGPIADYVAPPAPEPQYKTQFSVLEFRDRFTIEEQLTIRQAQFNDMEVGLVYDNFQAAQFIDVTDPRVEQGIDLYIAKGLLAPERKAQLLEPELIE